MFVTSIYLHYPYTTGTIYLGSPSFYSVSLSSNYLSIEVIYFQAPIWLYYPYTVPAVSIYLQYTNL